MANPTPHRRPVSVSQGLSRTLAALGLTLALVTGCGTGPARVPPESLTLTDLDGKAGPPVLEAQTRVAVFVFLGVECPIANRALPELATLEADLSPRGVVFFPIYPNADETPEAIRNHRREFGLPPRAFRDPGLEVARALDANRTPEVVALTRDGRLIYQGRVNDQFTALGVGRPAPTRHDLREALEAFLSGGPALGQRTPGVGCTFRSRP